MRLVFCGTPQFAVPTLEALLAAGHEIPLVISQPDKPVGRSGEINPTPVKRAALARGIVVTQPEKLKHNESLRETLTQIAPDAIIVVAYGRIIPQWMLDLPRYGCINGHGSLLPRWRGAAPIQWAIASGDTETGVTTMRLNAGLDTGPMLMKWAVTITPQTTSPELFQTLSTIGADLMVKTLAGLEAGLVTPTEQDDAQATLAPILTRDDARILFTRTATEIDQRFRGFQPWPGAFTTLRGKKLIVHAMHVAEIYTTDAPGTLVLRDGVMFAICANGTAIALDEVQTEGKKRMPADEFLRGFQIKSGEALGEATTQ
ncbi:methionyl-tRNA formyltransferase [Terriglobus roseus]|uniref:Methionyl-tRNA formyltransferase n=1 Tax=Terriglobus roseus TaxID=392734 RepID=A0A1H4KYF6_9BACT|nr:methionyl-tRNA formyltransferase [Terriglobus roseus]SEB63579.1 methionyl-tRNA formyltransferase [Terriglobus roseus]